MLRRDTVWSQGDLLTDEEAHTLGLVESSNSKRFAVVISHDCDLPNETEPYTEVIVGTCVPALDPTFANARHPRRLHLKFVSDSDGEICIELRHLDRKQIRKELLSTIGTRNGNFILPADEKRALKQWLAARYGRPAFPNAFEDRLRRKAGKKTVESKIAKILEPNSSHLVALFFDLGEDRGNELSDEDPYFLTISVVYDATDGGPDARASAELVAAELQKLFEQVYGPAETATEIAIETCSAVADTFMTLADLRRVDQWRLEYVSLREDPAGSFLSNGELPP